jgi:predicted metal-dependent hydrolase
MIPAIPVNIETTYTVRESARAKYARLKFSPGEGLVVVIPPGFDHALIPQLLQRNQRWLERASQWVEAQRRCYELEPAGGLPQRLELRGIDEQWELCYRDADSSRMLVVELKGQLLLFGDRENAAAVATALRRWLAKKALARLKPWLLRLARQYSFDVQGVSVKSQRSRWASCSSSKTISLNLKLLFLPPQLVEYTMLHELCHTIHLNHSQRFWALVKAYDIDYLAKDEQLKAAWQYVPAWLEAI